MDLQQLSLFRDFNDHDKDAFESAEKAKKEIALKAFEVYDKVVAKSPDANIYALSLTTDIKQVRDDSVPEPDLVKIFIRRIRTKCVSKYQEKVFAEVEKVIPEWANLVYTESHLSIEHFLEICRQIFSIENAIEFLKKPKFVDEVKVDAGERNIFLCFDHKVFPRMKGSASIESIHFKMACNRIYNGYNELKSICDKFGWGIIGNFADFTVENAFLKDLSVSPTYNKYPLSRWFVTDHLFLNNSQFMSQKHNTQAWPPVVLGCDIGSNPLNLSEIEGYFFAKEKEDSRFIRYEVYINKTGYSLQVVANYVQKHLQA